MTLKVICIKPAYASLLANIAATHKDYTSKMYPYIDTRNPNITNFQFENHEYSEDLDLQSQS